MKNIYQIQQEVAKEHNCKDWTVLRNSLYGYRIKFDGIWMDVANRYALEVAKETQRRCADNATLLIERFDGLSTFTKGSLAYIASEGDHFEVDKSSILDPKNLAI